MRKLGVLCALCIAEASAVKIIQVRFISVGGSRGFHTARYGKLLGSFEMHPNHTYTWTITNVKRET